MGNIHVKFFLKFEPVVQEILFKDFSFFFLALEAILFRIWDAAHWTKTDHNSSI